MFKEDVKPRLMEFLSTYRPIHRLIIIRNPWARLVSAYEDKIIDKKWNLQVGFKYSSLIIVCYATFTLAEIFQFLQIQFLQI